MIFASTGLGALGCFALAALPADGSVWTAAILLAVIGIGGSTFPVLIAHAKSFFPEHLTGRGVTLLNLFSIGGAGVMQVLTGRLMARWQDAGAAAYSNLFLFYGILVCCGLALYAFSEDRTD